MTVLARWPRALLSAAVLAGGAGSVAGLALTPAPAWAQAAAKAEVDAAKARGEVGEEADGLLGLVGGSGPRGAVAEINAGRQQAYRDAAARTGVTPTAAGEAAYRQLVARMPAGQYYKPAGAGWTQK